MNVEMPVNVVPKLESNEIKANQQNHFADKLQKLTIKDNSYLLRYEVTIDSAYLDQSIARVFVWNAQALSWNLLWNINVASTYFISESKRITDKDSHELASSLSSNGVACIATSWQKVYDALHAYAEAILENGLNSGR